MPDETPDCYEYMQQREAPLRVFRDRATGDDAQPERVETPPEWNKEDAGSDRQDS